MAARLSPWRRGRGGEILPVVVDDASMSPRRRPDGAPPPEYGGRSTKFTVQIHHGGFFVGNGPDRSYVGGSIICYDQMDTVSWSPVFLENLIEEIGYEMQGRVKVHYCIPLLSINRNGLRQIRSEEDTAAMNNFVAIGYHYINLYLEHDEPVQSVRTDDVVVNNVDVLPPVLSAANPRKRQEEDVACHEDKGPGHMPSIHPDTSEPEQGGRRRVGTRPRCKRTTAATAVEEIAEGSGVNDDDDEEDPDYEMIDSDYDISDGDDDLFADNVDEVQNGKEEVEMDMHHVKEELLDNDCAHEEDDLWAAASDDESPNKFKFKTFREEDMKKPIFHAGQVFESVHMLRKAIREYSCQTRWPITLPVNDKKRISAKCVEGCTWNLWASIDSRTKCWMIKRYHGQHSCGKKWKVHAFTSNFLADKYMEMFRADQDMNLKNFSRIIQRDWNMTPGRNKLQRARRLAMTAIYGDEEAQYMKLWDYANEIRRSNPGSSFFLSLDENSRFKQCYMSMDACKRGFLQGCRPIIFLDGCFIKTRYKGQLLAAVGIDPNDCIYPIAIASVEVEDTQSWTWFLETLKADLGIENTFPWTIMSDKQKGLINAVRDQFPDSEHRFCVRHMWQNFQQLFRGDALKNQLWTIARSSTVVSYEQHMDYMKTLNPDAHAWLVNLEPRTWVRAFQSDLPKCDILLNNNCEVFNRYILEARELPVLSMLERIKDQLMSRHYNKNLEADGWQGVICPKIKKKLDRNVELSNNSFCDGAGDGLFKVGEIVSRVPVDYIVDLKGMTCTCKRWEKSGIPCAHAISCCRHEGLDPVSMVDHCYSIEMYKKAYGNIVYPCRDKQEWEKMAGPVILPPNYKKHVGRPSKNRRKAPGEVDARRGGKKMSRHGVIIHCSYCKEPGHNIGGCNYLKQGIRPPGTEPDVPPTSTEAEPVITQEQGSSNPTPAYEDLAVENLSQLRPLPRIIEAMPTPQSTFISAAQRMVSEPQAVPNVIRAGGLAQQLLAMQQQKNKALEDKKLAILEARYTAELKKAEEKAKIRKEQEERKAEEAAAKAREAAEKREKKRVDAELMKQARAQTKAFVAQVKKGIREAEKKKAADERAAKREAEKKKAAEERAAKRKKSTATAPGSSTAVEVEDAGSQFVPNVPQKRVNMFDEFR